MTLVKFEPLRELESFSNHVQKLFGDFPSLSLDMNLNYHPKIDISEDEKNIIVEAEIPGIDKKDLKLVLEDNILTVSGQKNQESVKEGKNYYRSERSYGSFSRSFTMPVDVNSNKVDATYDKGVLKVVLEKATPKENTQKAIDIK